MYPGQLQIFNAQNVPITSKYTEQMLEVFIEFKVIKGDASDNIPSIGKKIGPKTALKLATNPKELTARFTKDPLVQEQYELNKRLMSFDLIPANIEADICKALETCEIC